MTFLPGRVCCNLRRRVLPVPKLRRSEQGRVGALHLSVPDLLRVERSRENYTINLRHFDGVGKGLTMPTSNRLDFANELAQIREFRASLKWIPLTKCFPESGAHVLVRLAEGRVEGGEWHADVGKWTHSPSVVWGKPLLWASLPSLRPTQNAAAGSISGAGVISGVVKFNTGK